MMLDKGLKTLRNVCMAIPFAALAVNVSAQEAVDHSTMDHSKMDHSTMDHGTMDHSQHSGDEHAQHRAMMNQKGYSRKEASYQLPDVTLTDQFGEQVSTASLLNGEAPVMLNFIFTSCTTICPVLSATFSQVQKEYGAELEGVKMVSISIDPEYDTPARLNEYAERFQAQEGWTFLTGDLDTVVEILTAFDAYRGDKMNHIPLAFLHAPDTATWVRLEGFASAGDLLKEYQAITPVELGEGSRLNAVPLTNAGDNHQMMAGNGGF